MRTLFCLFTALVVLLSKPVFAEADWTVIDACWRPDENPFAKTQVWDNWIWAEGWGEKEQFWPKYFKPAGSVHIILRNDSAVPADLQLSDMDGRDAAEVATNPKQAGRVVWKWFFPRQVQPGQWAECILRLRDKPSKDMRVGLRSGEKRFEVTVPAKPNTARLESISFSPNIDKLYLYVRALDGSAPKTDKVRLDMGGHLSCKWWPGPKGSGLALAEIPLQSPWELGTYHLIEVTMADGSTLAYPVRAWDN